MLIQLSFYNNVLKKETILGELILLLQKKEIN